MAYSTPPHTPVKLNLESEDDDKSKSKDGKDAKPPKSVDALTVERASTFMISLL